LGGSPLKKRKSDSTASKFTRRDLLKKAGQTGLTLAAAQALGPLALSGCSSDKPTGSGGGGGGGGKGGGGPHRRCSSHSLTGTMAISEISLKDVELMAIEEINKSGGVLGRQIEAVVKDPQSKFTDVFPDKARELLLRDKVAAVFGCWTSVSRKNVL